MTNLLINKKPEDQKTKNKEPKESTTKLEKISNEHEDLIIFINNKIKKF